MRLTGEHRSDLHLGVSGLYDLRSTFCGDHAVGRHDHITVRVFIIFCGVASCDTLLKSLDCLFSIHDGLHIHARNLSSSLAAILLADDKLL